MAQKYKVYYNDKIIIFTNHILQKYPETSHIVRIYKTVNVFGIFKEFIADSKHDNLIFISENPRASFLNFSTNFKLIYAAGGLVINEKNEFLFMLRNNRWDLPKGKKEKSESFRKAALREVMEETGLKKLSIVRKICDKWHIYIENHRFMLKRTSWFQMKGSSFDLLKPQTDEGITMLKWLNSGESQNIINESFLSVKDTFVTCLKKKTPA